jgi:hypothetical protein
MTIDPANAKLYGAWADFNDQAVLYAQTEATSVVTMLDNNGGGGMDHTDIYMAKNRRSTNGNAPAVAYHNTFQYAGIYDVNNSGGVYIYDLNGSTAFPYFTGRVYPAELTYHNTTIDQFTNMRIVTDGDNMHVSYYDTKTKSMKYWWGTSGSYPTRANYTGNAVYTPNMAARRWINIDGAYDTEDNNPNRVRQGGGTTGEARSARAGEWSAIDLRTDKKPVIAYFDDEHQTVRIAWSSVVDPGHHTSNGAAVTGSGNNAAGGERWTVQYAMNIADPNYEFSGNYISMRIDTSNNAHLAFLNTQDSTLVYLKLTWNGSGYTPGTSVVVDELGEGANWIDLSLDQENRPWISYLKDKKNFYDVMKMAYLDISLFSNIDDDNRGWEIMSVPARYYVLDSRTSIENWPSRDTDSNTTTTRFWTAAIGYKSSDYYRIAYYTKPNS